MPDPTNFTEFLPSPLRIYARAVIATRRTRLEQPTAESIHAAQAAADAERAPALPALLEHELRRRQAAVESLVEWIRDARAELEREFGAPRIRGIEADLAVLRAVMPGRGESL